MPASQQRKAVVFDFDGTLADTAPIIRSIYTELATKNKWKALDDKTYELLRRGTLGEARRWAGVRWWQYPSVLRSAKKLMQLEAQKVALFEGVQEMIEELYDEGYDLYVLSRNLPGTVARVLERYGLRQKMFILARRKRTLGSKRAVLMHLLRTQKYDRKKVWMVGDETRDIRAARIAGVNSVAVTWGIQHASILERFEPTCMATTVSDLRNILQNQ